MNFLVRDVNGQPQVIKVVQNSMNKSFGNLVDTTMTTGGQEKEVQVIKTVNLQSPGVAGGQQKVFKMMPTTKVTTVPAMRSVDPMVAKTIQLTPAQLNELKQALAQQHSEAQIVHDISNNKTYISPVFTSRKRPDMDVSEYIPDKRRKTEKIGKGLRHFSMKVCEKVQKKGTTSYNEVADELVGEFTNPAHANSITDQQYDQKNIRRRVYDALNVLMAMNIISKEKKEIKWLGLPMNSMQECLTLEKDKKKKIEKIKQKTQHLHHIILQHVAIKNLIERNSYNESLYGNPRPNSIIQLPFIIINTDRKTVVNCSISNDKTEYLLNFNDKFEIHDDIEILKEMGLACGLEKGDCSPEDFQKVKAVIPKTLEKYVEQMVSRDLEKFIPVKMPSSYLDETEIKIDTSRPPSSSLSEDLSEDALSPQPYFSEEEDVEESGQDDELDGDLDLK